MYNEETLDFSTIKKELEKHCGSKIAKELASQLEPMDEREVIQEALDETVEAIRSLQMEIEQPLGGTRDIRESCKKSRKDIVLTRENLWDILITIGAYKRMTKFFRQKYMEYPLLSLWVQDMPNYDFVYLGDNARAPYGSRSFEVVYEYTLQAVQKLFEMGCPFVAGGGVNP